MRFREITTEATLQKDVAYTLPATYVIPKLQNQDAYKQYRFGVAIAKAKGQVIEDDDDYIDYEPESAWGENQIVISYSNSIDQYIDAALKEIGLSPEDKKLISTAKSEENPTVAKFSPVARIKKNQYGV